MSIRESETFTFPTLDQRVFGPIDQNQDITRVVTSANFDNSEAAKKS
jgi:hypothetical protein